eukprot:g5410.t1
MASGQDAGAGSVEAYVTALHSLGEQLRDVENMAAAAEAGLGEGEGGSSWREQWHVEGEAARAREQARRELRARAAELEQDAAEATHCLQDSIAVLAQIEQLHVGAGAESGPGGGSAAAAASVADLDIAREVGDAAGMLAQLEEMLAISGDHSCPLGDTGGSAARRVAAGVDGVSVGTSTGGVRGVVGLPARAAGRRPAAAVGGVSAGALGAKVLAVLALGLVPGAAAVARVVWRTDPPAVVALEEMRCRVRRCLRDEAAGGGLQREDLLRDTATAVVAMSAQADAVVAAGGRAAFFTPSIAQRVDGNVATVSLNRPQKLNALDLDMIRKLRGLYDEWVEDDASRVKCIVMRGEGGKAFCAGGDVAAVQKASIAGGSLPHEFFYEEYALNNIIATMHARRGVSQVALWDGITMGGGVGLSVHGRFRVATERTVFAKPETAIGLFPDVGGTHMLPRVSGGMAQGLYIGLTGARLAAADCMDSGLATHYVPSARLALLPAALASLGERVADDAAVDTVLLELGAGAGPDAGSALLAPNADAIERCFSAPSAEEMLARLAAEGGAWAEAARATLARMSPTSVKLTIEACARHGAAGVSITDALEAEYRLSQRCMRPQPHSDFREGIRAVLLDKDPKSARWDPPTLEQVSAANVDAFFAPLGPSHPLGELELVR